MKLRVRDYRGRRHGDQPGQFYVDVPEDDDQAVETAGRMMQHDLVFALLDGKMPTLPIVKIVDEMSDNVIVVPDEPPGVLGDEAVVVYHLKTVSVPWLKSKRDEICASEQKQPIFPEEPE